MKKITSKLYYINEEGRSIGKYDIICTNLPANPKSSQGKMKGEYKRTLIEQLEKKQVSLSRFKDKEVLIYISVYLRPSRFETHDTDNFVKAIIDAIKPFIGDDDKVVSVFVEKKKLDGYEKADYDFIEQIFFLITTPNAKKDLFFD